MKIKITYILLFFSSLFCFSQNYNMSNAPVNTCAGTFFDSGGNTGDYSNNSTFTKTFCPSTAGSIIRFVFTSFNLEENVDFLYVYDGDSTAAPLLMELTGTDLPTVIQPTGTNTSGCITFVFTSDAVTTASGWSAGISCVTPCQNIVANLDSTTPTADTDNIIKICAGQSVDFSGSATFSTSSAGAVYTWDFDDGTTATGQNVSHVFGTPGVYRVNLVVNDPLDCRNANFINQIIQVSDDPQISFYSISDETCKDVPLDITANVSYNTFTYDCAPPVSGQTFLPDGSGVSYTTSIVVDCFPSSSTLTDVNQIAGICMNIEHSYLGDLGIEIISPNGQIAVLHTYPGGGITYLGDALDDGSVNPGIGFNYCFAMSGATTLVNGPTVAVTTGNAIAPGTYLPSGGFAPLLGSPLNGVWTIKVTDNLAVDNGYIFSWNIDFDPALAPSNLSFTPSSSSVSWTPDPTITNINGNTITVESDTPGTYCYTYTVVNNFGCVSTNVKCIEVLDAPAIVEDVPDLESCDENFDLNSHIPEILGSLDPLDYDVYFFASAADAVAGFPQLPSAYVDSSPPTIIYVRVENFALSCPAFTEFNLVTVPCGANQPDDMFACDDVSNDGFEIFDLTSQDATVLGINPASDYTITYHTTQSGADNNTDLASPFSAFNGTNQVIYVRMESIADPSVYYTTTFNLVVNPLPVADSPSDVTACDSYVLPALTVGNYYTGTGGSGTMLSAGDAITTTQTLYIYAETGTTPNCTDENSFVVTINITPVADSPSDVTACDSYVLPALTVGNYYTGAGGSGTMLSAGDAITTTQTVYVYAETGTTPNCTDENSFVVTINATPIADSPSDVTECNDYVLPALTVGNYYTGTGGSGTMLSAGDVITTTQTLYVYAETGTTPNCTDENSFTVTIGSPVADSPSDVTACDSYVLPALTVGNYYTGTGGSGTMLSAGDAITTTQTLYVYAETGGTPNCTDENSFVVTINATPIADSPSDVTECNDYVLPALTVGNYYTGTGGSGTMLSAGDVITTTQTLYIYAETGTTPNCTDENSFTVTIGSPVADSPSDVTACDSYVLPALTVGNYYTGTGGSGTMLSAGDAITTTQTLYVYAETGGTPNCTDENSFVVTINATPVADSPSDVTACDSYVLPALTVGNYYTGTGGSGTMLSAGDAITTTQTVYVYAETGTTPNCTDENSFVVTINATPVADSPSDVTACDSYVLPALTVGNYYTGTGGSGTMLSAGDAITTTQTLYIYAETGTTPNCTDENSFVVTINTTPVADSPSDVTACDSYVLPALTVGNYYTGTGGSGTMLSAGDAITTTQTLYIYAETGTTPNCTDENSFTVTINATPVADSPSDVTACDSYVLPALTVGNYYTGTGGSGTMLSAGDAITTTQTLYIYAETGTTPNCTDENSFTVTINVTPQLISLEGNDSICSNTDAIFTITGTPGAQVSYTGVVGLPASPVILNGSGTATVVVTGATIDQTITLTSITDVVTGCSQVLNLTETVTILPATTLSLNSDISTEDQTVCENFAITSIVYQVSGTATGVSVSGLPAGVVYSYDSTTNLVTINGTPTVSGTYNYSITTTGGCAPQASDSGVLNVTIAPTVTIVNNTPEICEGQAMDVTITSDVVGATIYWTASSQGINEVISGNGVGPIVLNQNITLLAGQTQPVDLVVTTYGVADCIGQTQTFTVRINPIPSVDYTIVDDSICSGETTQIELYSDEYPTATFTWTSEVISGGSVSGLSNGSGTMITDTLTTANLTPSTVVYHVTPTLGICSGTVIDITVTVNPIPVDDLTFSGSINDICSGETPNVTVSSGNTNVVYEWSVVLNGVAVEGGITSGVSTSNTYLIDHVLTTTGLIAGTAVYTFTPKLGDCLGVPREYTQVVNPLPQPALLDGSICVELSTGLVFQNHLLDSGIPNTSDYDFNWYYNGGLITGANQSTYAAELAGNYYVEVQNLNTGCSNVSNTINVIEINNATDFTYTVTNAFTDNATVTINVIDGNGSFLYQIDDQDLQESNVFTGVSAGEHTLTVVDEKGCTYLEKTILVIDYPKFFTPNGDGYNDNWNIIGLQDQPNTKLYIFDRYGKLIKQISPSGAGWDGTLNGAQLPSTDYWFTVEYEENQQSKIFKAHFSLKR